MGSSPRHCCSEVISLTYSYLNYTTTTTTTKWSSGVACKKPLCQILFLFYFILYISFLFLFFYLFSFFWKASSIVWKIETDSRKRDSPKSDTIASLTVVSLLASVKKSILLQLVDNCYSYKRGPVCFFFAHD